MDGHDYNVASPDTQSVTQKPTCHIVQCCCANTIIIIINAAVLHSNSIAVLKAGLWRPF